MSDKDYSFRALIDKLNVKEGARVLLRGVDDAALAAEIRARTPHLAEGRQQKENDVILLSVESVAELRQIETCYALMAPAGGLWVIYPKGRKDITEAQVMTAGLATGMVDNKVISFSATHTGLRFVIRKADRLLIVNQRNRKS
jgi:hypothetical protein